MATCAADLSVPAVLIDADTCTFGRARSSGRTTERDAPIDALVLVDFGAAVASPLYTPACTSIFSPVTLRLAPRSVGPGISPSAQRGMADHAVAVHRLFVS